MLERDPDQAAADRFVAACAKARVQRVLVIGGTPEARASLVTLLAALDLRPIDGSSALNDDRANRLADWADVVVLWDQAALHHSVTEHFLDGRTRTVVVVVDQPEIAAFLDDATLHLPLRAM